VNARILCDDDFENESWSEGYSMFQIMLPEKYFPANFFSVLALLLVNSIFSCSKAQTKDLVAELGRLGIRKCQYQKYNDDFLDSKAKRVYCSEDSQSLLLQTTNLNDLVILIISSSDKNRESILALANKVCLVIRYGCKLDNKVFGKDFYNTLGEWGRERLKISFTEENEKISLIVIKPHD
jgi:hypothetical protein